ncbi:MAG: alkaline phosphatase family protein [Terriglobales bacterium]
MKTLLLPASLMLFLTGVMDAQSSPFQHIIIVIQENRTPDDLFGASGVPGADVQINGGKARPVSLSEGNDFNHTHAGYLAEINGQYPETARNYVASGAQPYWDLAAQYGFANRMFQTNQGASFPAHQFLISGSSAPSDSSDLFVVDGTVEGQKYGCKSPPDTLVPTMAPDGSMGAVYPCFDRSSLIDLLTSANLTWKYYAVPRQDIWDAPDSLTTYYKSPNIVLNPPQVLSDIANGVLANVSWVTPAKAYSDHPATSTGGGPAWVASIVNAVGQSAYWQNTAIIVTWDDWGGFYDHVPPLVNNTGWCTLYCYGFRVPLLVISAYTPVGYIDNDVHDFGSILHFVETNFGIGNIGNGGWADSFADDLGGFFQPSAHPREFHAVKSRKLTQAELSDKSDPDDY